MISQIAGSYRGSYFSMTGFYAGVICVICGPSRKGLLLGLFSYVAVAFGGFFKFLKPFFLEAFGEQKSKRQVV